MLSGSQRQNGLPANRACNAAAPTITSPTITPSIAAGDVMPTRTSAMSIGFQANRNITAIATPTMNMRDMKPSAGHRRTTASIGG